MVGKPSDHHCKRLREAFLALTVFLLAPPGHLHRAHLRQRREQRADRALLELARRRAHHRRVLRRRARLPPQLLRRQESSLSGRQG